MKTVVFSANCELFLPGSEHQLPGDSKRQRPGDGSDSGLAPLGQAVRRLREQQSMSAEQLADATGMTRQRIDLLETGRLDPTYELLLALADGLGIQLSALVTLTEQIKRGASGP